MAEKLHFSLVSPEREMFSGEVDQVDAPGSEGMFGVLPMHAPFMTTLRRGAVTVFQDGDTKRIFVRGGFADVTPDGLTILAEEAIELEKVDAADVAQRIQDFKEDIEDAKDDEAREKAEQQLAYYEALSAALNES